jgi:hypothetical protein
MVYFLGITSVLASCRQLGNVWRSGRSLCAGLSQKKPLNCCSLVAVYLNKTLGYNGFQE